MRMQPKFKCELLLPAGSVEAFYAAMKGGANAIYLGLKSFNARGRATNFSYWQAAAAIKEAHKKQVKVYIALNTVIRNKEIDHLIDTLSVISQIKPDAVIVQDWGVFYLISKFFPQLTVHASTQMANHNSAGINYAAKLGFKRVVLARELTKVEIEHIASRSQIETEIFIHGALCYSFSGMCLFSSFLGGASANRGQCTQPCRRNYLQNENESYFFSLKDNQLLEHLPFIEKLKINSLKVEGRLKPAEYVFQVASAYRKALDFPAKREEAQQQLQMDLGREKTDYFFGKSVSEAITQSAGTGFLLGYVTQTNGGTVTFSSSILLEETCRIRFRSKSNDQQNDFNINNLQQDGTVCKFQTKSALIAVGDEVYLSGAKMKFTDKIKTDGIKINDRCPTDKLNTIKSNLIFRAKPKKTELYLRIDRLEMVEWIVAEKYETIILNLTRNELTKAIEDLSPLKKNQSKIQFELPKFISEVDLEFYRNVVNVLFAKGFTSFFISHLSQIDLLPKGTRFNTNENVYVFNDAAIKMVRDQGVSRYIYPFENDIVNMAKGTDRDGIVPVYFYPQLFYSRMPVKIERETVFADKNGEEFRKLVRDGITIIVPKSPVSLTLYKNKLERYGFSRFLIDLSSSEITKIQLQSIEKRLSNSESIPNTSVFNFKRELK